MEKNFHIDFVYMLMTGVVQPMKMFPRLRLCFANVRSLGNIPDLYWRFLWEM